MRPGDAPVLSFVRPSEPYVSIGYHRDLAEVDTDYCRAGGLPVYRRMVGGGPVYLRRRPAVLPDQPAGPGPAGARRSAAAGHAAAARGEGATSSSASTRSWTGSARSASAAAKVCGHGAGQLGDGAAIVGNLISGFDHERATRVLRLDPDVREVVLQLMRRYVAATPIDPAAWQAAMVREYAEHFGSEPTRRPARPRRRNSS